MSQDRIVSDWDPNVMVPRSYVPLTKTQAARIISYDLRRLRKGHEFLEGKRLSITAGVVTEYLDRLRSRQTPPAGPEISIEAAQIANPRTVLREIQRADQPTKERVKS